MNKTGLFLTSLLVLIISITGFCQGIPFDSDNHIPAFIENKGQIVDQDGNPRDDVQYSFFDHQISVFLLKDGISYQFNNIDTNNNTIKTDRIDLKFVNAQHHVQIIPSETETGYTNYYLTQKDVPFEAIEVKNYRKITFKDIYPYTDIIFEIPLKKEPNAACHFKYSFILHPGADMSQIQMRYSGNNSLLKETSNRIRIENESGYITDETDHSFYAETNEKVDIGFQKANDIVTFSGTGNIVTKTLVIDPSINLYWGTYYGGSDNDYCNQVAVDYANNVYLIGNTYSTSHIATTGSYQVSHAGGGRDAYIVKFNTNGVRQWATYYGGSSEDRFYGAYCDASGQITAAGWTGSTSGISTSGSFQSAYGGGSRDAFIVRFNSSGVRQWATYYGGSGFDEIFSIKGENYGNFVFAGWTESTNNISTTWSHQTTYGGSRDGFVAKFNSFAQRLWSTYLGGSNLDCIQDITLDVNNNIIAAGYTASTNNISSSGAFQSSLGGDNDALIVKFNSNGTRLWGTYFGGVSFDRAQGIVADPNDNILITGWTGSPASIASAGAHRTTFGGGSYDGFIAKFNSTGSRQWSTYYGGGGVDYLYDIKTNCFGYAYVCGTTSSTAGISTSNGFKTTKSTGDDGCFARFDYNGNLIHGTYYGGASTDLFIDMALDKAGSIYIGGQTNSTSGISTSGSHQSSLYASTDAFLVKFCDIPAILNNPVSKSACVGDRVKFSAFTCSASGFQWLKNGTIITGATDSVLIIAKAKEADSGYYSCIVSNLCGSDTSNSAKLSLFYGTNVNLGNDTILCQGNSVLLDASTSGATYLWNDNSSDSSLTATKSGKYWVVVTYNNCKSIDTINIIFDTLKPLVDLGNDTFLCAGSLLLDGWNPGCTYRWSTGSTDSAITINKQGIYWVEVKNSCFIRYDSIKVSTDSLFIIDLGPDTSLCAGSLLLNGWNPGCTYRWSTGSTDSSITINRQGTYWVEVKNNCFTLYDSIKVSIDSLFILDLGPDTTICSGQSLLLIAGNNNNTYKWNTGSADSFIIADKNGQYSVEVTNACGSGIDSVIISIMPEPEIYLPEDTAFCINSSNDLSPISFHCDCFLWSTGDTVSKIKADKDGLYWVKGINKCGFFADSVNVIHSQPQIDYQTNDTSVCAGDFCNLTVTGAFNIKWFDGTASNSILLKPIQSNYYSFELTDSVGCTLQDSIKIIVIRLDKVDFSINDTLQCLKDNSFIFANKSDTTKTTPEFIWYFDSGVSIYNQNIVQYSFTSPGKYKVMLHAELMSSCKDSVIKFIEVQPNPNASFSINMDSCTAKVSFFNNSNDQYKYKWYFGNSKTSFKPNPVYTFPKKGEYLIKLVVESMDGCIDSSITALELIPFDSDDIKIPNVFTPNNDGMNDLFFVKSDRMDCITGRLLIFNRWGQQIYDSWQNNHKLEWDGFYEDILVSSGVYVFVLSGNFKTRTGTITVIY